MKETNKKTLAKLLALSLVLGGTGVVAVSQASADSVSQHPPQMGQPMDFGQNVSRSVEKIDNGVVITLTSDDADTVQKLQEDAQHGPMHDMENVTRTVVHLDNGVQITLSSDDAETVQRLQEGPKGDHRGGDRHQGLPENVTRSVEYTDTGVVITLSSDDPDTVKMLQDHEKNIDANRQ